MKKISYISFTSLVITLIAISVICIYGVTKIPGNDKSELKYFNFLEFPLFFGICVYQFEGNTTCLQIENSMNSPKQFRKVSIVGIIIIVALESTLAIIGYLAFINDAEEIVIDSIGDYDLRMTIGYFY